MPELVRIESEKNISEAWGKAFIAVLDKTEISPLIISVTGFDDFLEIPENKKIREALDASLTKNKQSDVLTVANTIFPRSLWNPDESREKLYKRHSKIKPSIKSCRANQRGHYFRRMVDYNDDGEINQLDEVLNLWRKNRRHSGMQIAFFDPKRDHINSPYMGFPCLHQVSFDSYGAKGRDGLGITAFYGMQYIYRKAYGNYLGLCRLGKFMAKEMGLKFVRFNCIASKAKMGNGLNKTSPQTLHLKKLIEEQIQTEQ